MDVQLRSKILIQNFCSSLKTLVQALTPCLWLGDQAEKEIDYYTASSAGVPFHSWIQRAFASPRSTGQAR